MTSWHHRERDRKQRVLAGQPATASLVRGRRPRDPVLTAMGARSSPPRPTEGDITQKLILAVWMEGASGAIRWGRMASGATC